MITVSDNMIAIGLYIGIMLMAGTVLVLTIVYFVKPTSTKTKESSTSDIKATIKKKVFKIPAIKVKSKKTETAAVEIKKPENQTKEVVPPVESTKPEYKNNKVTPVIVPIKPENEEVTVIKTPAEVRPENKNAKPEVKTAVKPEKELDPIVVSQPEVIKNKKQDQSVPMETPKAAVITATPLSPKPETDNHSLDEKEQPAAVEAVKKELEPKMDNKNVKPAANVAAEKPQNATVTVKTTIVAASPAAGKKGPEQKPSLDDFSKMFSKEAVDDSEATKLAKEMKEVEIDSLVKDGQDLIALLKRGRS
jgi:hypothetical protein